MSVNLHNRSFLKLLDFTPEDHGLQKYSIPVDEIEPGECYVVVAHFADGSSVKSRVFQKN